MGIGTDSTISNGQIKQARLAYKGDFGHSYVKPDVPFLQITHHPTSRIQTKRTSSAQHDRVYFVGRLREEKASLSLALRVHLREYPAQSVRLYRK